MDLEGIENTIAGCSLYAPNEDDPNFFYHFFQDLERVHVDHFMIGADFNTVMNPVLDLKRGKGHSHPKCTEFINQYCDMQGLVDVWCIRHPTDFRYMWCKKKAISNNGKA